MWIIAIAGRNEGNGMPFHEFRKTDGFPALGDIIRELTISLEYQTQKIIYPIRQADDFSIKIREKTGRPGAHNLQDWLGEEKSCPKAQSDFPWPGNLNVLICVLFKFSLII